jgi:hypothetical protein
MTAPTALAFHYDIILQRHCMSKDPSSNAYTPRLNGLWPNATYTLTFTTSVPLFPFWNAFGLRISR